jgi:hypothetical protein
MLLLRLSPAALDVVESQLTCDKEEGRRIYGQVSSRTAYSTQRDATRLQKPTPLLESDGPSLLRNPPRDGYHAALRKISQTVYMMVIALDFEENGRAT